MQKNIFRLVNLVFATILLGVLLTLDASATFRGGRGISTPPPIDPASFTTYPAGVTPIAVTEPGIYIHEAQNASGVQAADPLYYDPLPPTLASSPKVLSAHHWKTVPIQFADQTDLSGVATASVTITGPTGTTTHVGGATVNATRDWRTPGFYNLSWSATDNAGNTASGTVNNFFQVVANVPTWAASKSTVSIDSTSAKVADNNQKFYVLVRLKDNYGNPIITKTGLKNVEVNFKFTNTLPLDQVNDEGDGIHLKSTEFSYDAIGADTGSTKLNETGYLTESADGDGEYLLEIRSYSPTSNAYAPIAGDGFNFKLAQVSYRVTPIGGLTDVGAVNTSISLNQEFKFMPALTATPEAVNYDISSGDYESDSSADDNVVANTIKRFQITLENQSSATATSQNSIGLLATTGDGNLTWQEAGFEKLGSNDLASPQTISLDTESPFTNTWNAIPSPLNTLAASTYRTLLFQSRPNLTEGSTVASETDTTMETYLSYVIGGRNPKYKGEAIDFKIAKPSFQNLGASSSQLGEESYYQENKVAMDRQTTGFINNPTSVLKACKGSDRTLESDNWNSFSCNFQNNSILFFKDVDVYLDDGATLTLPSGAKTILVQGGDVYVRSNLIYDDIKDDVFGIVILKKDNGNSDPLDDGGNLFIDPSVTNMVGSLYAEGSIISLNHEDYENEWDGTACAQDGSDGFCDRAYELNNQLYWKGYISSSHNTNGSSDDSPPACPSQIASMCGGDRNFMRVFDYNYIRNFHPGSGGQRAGGLLSDGSDTDADLPNPPEEENNQSAFILEITSKVAPLFSESGSATSNEVSY